MSSFTTSTGLLCNGPIFLLSSSSIFSILCPACPVSLLCTCPNHTSHQVSLPSRKLSLSLLLLSFRHKSPFLVFIHSTLPPPSSSSLSYTISSFEGVHFFPTLPVFIYHFAFNHLLLLISVSFLKGSLSVPLFLHQVFAIWCHINKTEANWMESTSLPLIHMYSVFLRLTLIPPSYRTYLHLHKDPCSRLLTCTHV